MKIQIGFIGAGWRAHCYMKVIDQFQHRMEVSSVFVRSKERAEQMEQEYPGKVDTNLEAFLSKKHDFVIVLIPREHVLYYIEALMKRGIPVLSETPPGNGIEELNLCYALKQKYHAKIQVSEQCFLRPYYQAVLNLIGKGSFGQINNVSMEMLHDYHAMSVTRKILGVGYENCTIDAKEYYFPVHYHCGREGIHPEDARNVIADHRKRADVVFESGKTLFYDFSDEQYFNYFRTRHLCVRGELGEIFDFDTSFWGTDGYPHPGKIIRDELGQYENLEGYALRGILHNGMPVYRNPYCDEGVRLSDDEIAMACILDGMKRYIDTGEEIYPLEEALQDTYLHLIMDESVRQKKAITTEAQTWVKLLYH